MIRNEAFRALTLVAGLVCSTTAYSATKSSATPAQLNERLAFLNKVCADDMNNYCRDVTPGEGRIAACLDSRLDQLDTPCRLTWNDAKADISKTLDRGELAFNKNCGEDVLRFCSAIPTGRGRILDCLGRHEDALSPSCKKLQAKIAERLNKYLD